MENAQEEVVPPETIDVPEEVVSEPSPPQKEEKKEESDKEFNFRLLREERERLKSENEEFRRQIQSLHSPESPKVAQSDGEGLDDSDLVEYKQLKAIKKELDSLRYSIVPDKLRAKFKDFDEIVNQESLQKLSREHQETFATINAQTDPYLAGVSAYEFLKSKEMANKSSPQPTERVTPKKVPMSSAAVKNSSPLNNIADYGGRLTKEMKDRFYKEHLEELNKL